MTRGRPAKVRPEQIPTDDLAEIDRRRAIGVRLAQCRADHGWSLRDVAARSGLALAEIRRLETGEADAKMSTLVLLARALGCTEKWLLLGQS